MLKDINKNKIILMVFLFVGLICLEIISLAFCFMYVEVNLQGDNVLPNTYLGKYKISNVGYDKLNDRIEFYSKGILNNKVVFKVNDKNYVYKFSDLGLTVDISDLSKKIINEEKSVGFFEKNKRINNRTKKVYNYEIDYDEGTLKQFINDLSLVVNRQPVNDRLVVTGTRDVLFTEGSYGFVMDVEKSLNVLIEKINGNISGNINVDLVGQRLSYTTNESYRSIDTKVSSFVTKFDPYISRATNLKVALNYIDGAVIMPGEVFSFYNYAGPYNKKGYVFYYEFVGNGVCQIATTVYNAALLGGLEIVKRYPHAAKSVYVDGGLDATVASYASGWHVDFQFKNTYDYPIYISAYANGGEAHVDFWSNSKAKKGKTYTTESVKIGTRGYRTFLHTYQDGVWLEKKKITDTWYSKD